ncbi:hypothetical protein, partial [Bariatricus massiliensis]
AVYDNGDEEVIDLADCTIAPDPLTEADTKVTISYTEDGETRSADYEGLTVTKKDKLEKPSDKPDDGKNPDNSNPSDTNKPGSTTGTSGKTIVSGNSTTKNTSGKGSYSNTVKTGDMTPVFGIVLVLAVATVIIGGAITSIVIRKKKTEKEDDETDEQNKDE